MAELTGSDLASFTGGRIADNDEADALVAAALVAARRYCGWSVSPVAEVTVTIDGSGGDTLPLPTRNLLSVSAVSENGSALDVTKLDISRRSGTVVKFPRSRWTSRPGGVTVTMSHGYTEAEAADWRRAVLRLADAMSAESAASQRDTQDLIRKKIDDVEYQWGTALLADNDRLAAMFSPFRILQSP